MGGKDSIQAVKPIAANNVKRTSTRSAKQPKQTKTFWEKAKDYLRFARDTNSNNWANENRTYANLFRKK